MQNSPMFEFFGMRNLNLRSILKPEVVILVFLCTRSDEIMKDAFKMLFSCKIPPCLSFSA